MGFGTGRWVTALLLAGALCVEAQEAQTAAEASGFAEHTPYAEMMDFLSEVRAGSTEMVLTSYGQTLEGRTLPLAVFSRPRVSQPWEAWALGRPIVSLNANVHGDERALRESLLLLVRELATPGTEAHRLLDHLVVLVAPQINPDGFEASSTGTRGNAWGIDMNRDWVKLEQPALVAYATNVVGRWRPHVLVDGHSGGSLPYNLNYQCPSHAESDQRITDLCDQEIFPAIDRRLEAAGYRSFYYQRGTETRWDGGGFDARIGRNYGGFTNTLGILFESPDEQPLAPAVASGVLAFKAVLEYAHAHAERVLETVSRARLETIALGSRAEGEVVVDMEYEPEDFSVEYEVPSGEGSRRRMITVRSDSLMKKPVATKTRPRPFAYLLPRDAIDAVAMLRRHGISVERLERPVTLEVDAYRLVGVTYEQAYNHDGAVRLELGEVITAERSFPAGTYVVTTGQMLGRLAAHMLEPETNDNVIYWNTMDAWLPKAALASAGEAGASSSPLVPIFKLMEPTPLPAVLISR